MPQNPKTSEQVNKESSLEVNFNKEEGTVLLGIREPLTIPENLVKQAEKMGLSRKETHHITVIGSDTAEHILEIMDSVSEEKRKDLFSRLEKLVQDTQWSYNTKPEFFYIAKEYNDPDPEDPDKTIREKRESIIQLINLPGLEKFYNELNKIFDDKMDVPFLHITLYTTSTREDKRTRGIGIYSRREFEDLGPQNMRSLGEI